MRRAFHSTPKGALHYVVRGDVKATPPLVLFHAHPRSGEQFKLLASNIPASQPFIAVDYFGAGSSDECECNELVDEFVGMNDFAKWVLDICDVEGVDKLVPFGSETGASAAIELAWLASKQGRVDAMVYFEAYYLSPKAKQYIDNVYIPSVRHLPIVLNGSHLLFWWTKPDAGPIGPTSMAPVEADLNANEQKTIDALLNLRTGWQFKKAWSAYNDLIPGRLADLVRANVSALFIDAGFADWLGNHYGLDKDWSRAHINAIIPDSLRTNVEISNATEGALEQNATVAAKAVRDFFGGWPPAFIK